jgi:hypothetical protein
METIIEYKRLLKIKPTKLRPNTSYLESRVRKVVFTLKRLKLERYSDTRMYIKNNVEGGKVSRSTRKIYVL